MGIAFLVVFVVFGVFIGVQWYRHRAEKPWRNDAVPNLFRFKRPFFGVTRRDR